MLLNLETIVSPPYKKVNDVEEVLVFNPITQNNSVFTSQIIAKDHGSHVESKVGLEGMVQQLDVWKNS